MENTLINFIQQKKVELEQSGDYKSVTLHSAYSVQLKKFSVGEQFFSEETSKEQLGIEVNLADLPSDLPSIPFKENGTRVTFELIAKGRRKPHTLDFYFLWEQGDQNG